MGEESDVRITMQFFVASEIQEVTQTATPVIGWQMDIPLPMTAYRAYRVPSLYPGVIWQY
jgi:hypothetical protein